MKQALAVLAIAAVFAISATTAKGDTIAPGSEISITGSNFQFNPTAGTVTFAPNGTGSGAGNYAVGGVSNTFATYFSSPNAVTLFPGTSGSVALPLGSMSSHTPPGGSVEILTTSQNGETLTFFLNSDSWTAGPDSTGMFTNLSVTGTGTFVLSGAVNYTPELAAFNFTAQQTPDGFAQMVTFSGTGTAIGPAPSPAPEPSSLALLGTGLLGAAAIARRRFSGRFSA